MASSEASKPTRLYRRAFSFVLPYWKSLGFVLFISMLGTLLGLAQPYFLKILIDDAFLSDNFSLIIWVSGGLFLASVLSLLLNALSGYRYVQVSARVLFDMRLMVLRHLQRLSPRFYARTPTGDILSRLNSDVSEIQRIASDTYLSTLSSLVFLIGTSALLLYLEPRLFLISLSLLPLSAWFLRRYRQRVMERNIDVRETSAGVGSFLVEAFLGMGHTIAFRQEEAEMGRFREKNESFVRALLKMRMTSYLASGVPGLLLSLSTLVVFVAGGYLVLNSSFSMGSFVAYTAYHARLFSPVSSLMGLYMNLQSARASLVRVFELLDHPPEVVELDNAVPLESVLGEICFQDVSLDYQRGEAVLKKVSFRMEPGKITAVVGSSGVGKSTLVDLLLRRLDPDEGVVLLDGHDLRTLKLADLRGHIGVVQQDTFLWNASIAENIRYGKPEASQEEIEEAARGAGIHDFIQGLPEGYQTPAGERGLQLSTGQRQRIAIARALLLDSEVLVLDEATSALDEETEATIADTLLPVLGSRTTLILSHRLPLVRKAGWVVVLDEGRIVQQGRVEELLNQIGVFRRLFQSGVGRQAQELHR